MPLIRVKNFGGFVFQADDTEVVITTSGWWRIRVGERILACSDDAAGLESSDFSDHLQQRNLVVQSAQQNALGDINIEFGQMKLEIINNLCRSEVWRLFTRGALNQPVRLWSDGKACLDTDAYCDGERL
jgi:hypothetical protein